MITKIIEYVTVDNLGNEATQDDVERYMEVAKRELEKEFACEVVVLNEAGTVEVEVDADTDTYEGRKEEQYAIEEVQDFIGKNWTDWILPPIMRRAERR